MCCIAYRRYKQTYVDFTCVRCRLRIARCSARQHEYVYLGALMPIGLVAALVQANRPIVVGRTLIFGDGKGLSTTTGVMVHAG